MNLLYVPRYTLAPCIVFVGDTSAISLLPRRTLIFHHLDSVLVRVLYMLEVAAGACAVPRLRGE